jgi:hypothetical protein
MKLDPTTVAAIESFLLHQDNWIPITTLCDRFEIRDDRDLRGAKGKPGPIAHFSITHTTHGIRHVALASPDEFRESYHARARHSITQLRTIRLQRKNRHHKVITPASPHPIETFTRQEILSL